MEKSHQVISPSVDFRPVSRPVIARMATHVQALADAGSVDAALAALYLLHCEMRDALEMIPGTASGGPDFSGQQMQPLPAGQNTGENL